MGETAGRNRDTRDHKLTAEQRKMYKSMKSVTVNFGVPAGAKCDCKELGSGSRLDHIGVYWRTQRAQAQVCTSKVPKA